MIDKKGYARRDKIKSTGSAPGYRKFFLTVDIDKGNEEIEEVELCFDANDAIEIFNDLYQVYKHAYPAPVDNDDENIHEWKFELIKKVIGIQQ
ncbi:MAG: hypothetical protein WA916_08800 [Arcobacter sp.]|uniref:hypothetical protein n=1 Tax=Arcobacter sp. TaxID=1872629 RepID=UPI003C711F3F